MIANNTVSLYEKSSYDGNKDNHELDIADDMIYVDIDGEVNIPGVNSPDRDDTFSSSNATFENPFESEECIKIIKAYLYWSASDLAIYDRNFNNPKDNIDWWNFNDVLLKTPNKDYQKLTADKVIYRGRTSKPVYSNEPYVCIKDITKIVQDLESPFTTYQIANVESKIGSVIHLDTDQQAVYTGACGGWQIVFVYENETSIARSISLFDGYKQISSFNGTTKPPLNIYIDGFSTLENEAPVNANILFGALEGDRNVDGDRLSIKNTAGIFQNLSTATRSSNNFFTSAITLNNSNFTQREPASLNTLGFDAGLFELNNPGNSVIGNGQKSVELQISSKKETYGLFSIGFSVEVFAPNLGPINVADNTTDAEVIPNQEIENTIEFRNNGNDDALGATLTTEIAPQLDLIQPIEGLQNGITYTFDEASRILTFDVPANLVVVNGPEIKISYKTKVKNACFFISESCENATYTSQVIAKYKGNYNKDEQTTASSNQISECGGNNEPNQYTVVSIAPNWSKESIDATVECDDIDGLKDAQALVPKIEPLCDGKYYTITKTAGEFVQTNDDCAAEGYYENTFTYSDKCNNKIPTTFKQKITIVDTTPPTIEDCSDKLQDLVLDCGKKESLQKQADDWHKNNLELIAQCAKDNCSEISPENIKNNYSFIVTDKPICEVNGEKTAIEYKIFDACGTAKPLIKVLNIIYKDETGPDVSLCKDKIQEVVELECTGEDPLKIINDWHANNIQQLLGCAKDECNPELPVSVIDSLGQFKKDCGKSGSIEAFYYALDTCKQKSVPVKALLLIKDTTGPFISDECIASLEGKGECDAGVTEEEAIAWNQSNYEKLKCAADSCSDIKNITDNFDFNNYVVTDCGGTLKTTYFITDNCDNVTAVDAFYYTGDAQPPLITCEFTEDDNLVLECGDDNHQTLISTWKDKIYAKLNTCITDECTPDLIPIINDNLDTVVLKDPVDCGKGKGSVNEVLFKVYDNCDNFRPLKLIIYVEDTTGPEIKDGCIPIDAALECLGKDATIDEVKKWDLANMNSLVACAVDGCRKDAEITVTSSLDLDNLPEPDCVGDGKKTPIVYTLSDGCNDTTFTVNLSLEDATPPTLKDNCISSIPVVLECDGDNVAVFNKWHQDNLNILQSCAQDGCALTSQLAITSNKDSIKIPEPGCKGQGKTVDVTYFISDNCNNVLRVVLPVKIEDTTPPTISPNCISSVPKVLECDGDNVNLMKQWHQKNMTDLLACATDGCAVNSQLTLRSNFDAANIPVSACPGQGVPIDIKYTVEDNCGNSRDYIIPVSIEDSTPPDLTASLAPVIDVVCNKVPDPKSVTFKDGCNNFAGSQFTSDTTFVGKDDIDYILNRKWKVWDSCDNDTTYTQTVNVKSITYNNTPNDQYCFDDGIINLNKYIDTTEIKVVDWAYKDGPKNKLVINKDGTFDPLQIEVDSLGDYTFTYTSTKGLCFEETVLDLNINDSCIVYPCGPENFTISKTITPNGDAYNQYFTIIGSRECEFKLNLKIFNRWGAIVYENPDYKNDWDGDSIKGSIGTNGKIPNGTYFYVVELVDSGFERLTGPLYVGTK